MACAEWAATEARLALLAVRRVLDDRHTRRAMKLSWWMVQAEARHHWRGACIGAIAHLGLVPRRLGRDGDAEDPKERPARRWMKADLPGAPPEGQPDT
jgi:hypothetical protein